MSVIVQYDFHHDMHLDSSWHIISLIALYKLLDRVLCNKKRLKLNAMLLPSINLFCFQHDVMEKQIELHFSSISCIGTKMRMGDQGSSLVWHYGFQFSVNIQLLIKWVFPIPSILKVYLNFLLWNIVLSVFWNFWLV